MKRTFVDLGDLNEGGCMSFVSIALTQLATLQ